MTLLTSKADDDHANIEQSSPARGFTPPIGGATLVAVTRQLSSRVASTITLPWGKTSEGRSHHLAHHCADVAACFEAIAALPVVKARMDRAAGRKLLPVDLSRFAVLAFLHDCGKLHPGFQAKGGWPDEIWPKRDWHGHVREGAAIFTAEVMNWEIARHLHLDTLIAWGVDTHLLFSVLAHHGKPFRMSEVASKRWREVPEFDYDPVEAAAEIGKMLPHWFEVAFSEEGRQLPSAADFQHFLCGLVSLADWLGSTRSIFDFEPELNPGYITQAREKARCAVAHIGLDTARWRGAIDGDLVDFSTLLPGKQARAAQQLVGNWPLDDELLVLEAETGSGKTEAALWRFARLFQAGVVDSLYFALPTRAAAKQIHGRINETMRNLFGPDAPEAVLAVPGYLRAGEVEGTALPEFKVLWHDDGGLDEKKRLARWAAESANRYLAATIAVGTVDQAMLAGLQVKHAHLRAAALSRALLVVDEVHASDRYMTEIQRHLLEVHLRRGGHAILMSATLGSAARTRWMSGRRAQPPTFEEAVATPYPAVWGGADSAPRATGVSKHQKVVAMNLITSWKASKAADRAISAAGAGARVLVIRNTVQAALDTFAAIQQSGNHNLLWHVRSEPALHHSRYAPEDRKLLDQEVGNALSPNERMEGGVIVIGTQTLEQSLDIDSDLLITDLCPVDVLLQRIGRLHRHPLSRPAGFEQPQCLVLSPEQGLSRLVAPSFDNGLGMFRDGGGVYRNLHACELTLRLIRDHAEWTIPAMNRFLVESATHDDRISALNVELGEAWALYWNTVYGKEIAEAAAATYVAIPEDTPFADVQFASDEQQIRTRLGGAGAVIRFVDPITGPFQQRISSVTLPDHWSRGIDTTDPVQPVTQDGIVEMALEDRRFYYDRQGLRRG